jgi:hypothetical protein
MSIPVTIDLHVASRQGASAPAIRRSEPLRVGVPIARGVCAEASRVRLTNAGGREQLVQAKALDTWSDGSVRWLLVDFLADVNGQDAHYHLSFDGAPGSTGSSALVASSRAGEVLVETGAAVFRLSAGGHFPFDDVRVGERPAMDAARSGLQIQMADGRRTSLIVDRASLEDTGPVRAIVRLEGSIRSGPEDLLRVDARMHFFAGSATVRFEVTLHNPRRAEHPGGFWELGDPGSQLLRDASFVFALPDTVGEATVAASIEDGAPMVCLDVPLELFQASSGGANWNSPNHLNRSRRMPLAFQGYRLRSGQAERAGLRANPLVTLQRGAHEITAGVPQFWQNFPKALESDGSGVVVRLFPGQHHDPHELQGGEQKTHVLYAAFGTDHVSEMPLDWTRAPLVARASPEHYCASRAIAYLTASADDEPAYAALVTEAVDGPDTFERKRERIDEYGWRNFGDLYADHEAVFHEGTDPLVSHYNNQYDAAAGFALQFMRSGDPRWWGLFADLAPHVRDVDIYHTEQDKAAYNGALFWHTSHYVDVGLATHRSYPRAPNVGGGGPANEHNYSRGLLLHYFLTGDARSRDAVVGLARWVVDMDDGRKTVFRWLDRGDTGLASQTASTDYHGPGRGAGNSIKVLLDGFTVSGDPAFLRKAETIIRRCIHPRDDISSRNLSDPESRWSYTVFLHALGTYLDARVDRGGADDPVFAYARESLLVYAEWMAAHEAPYLDHPEKLEYPTETWVAQELWKSEVFGFAAKYGSAAQRDVFLERSDFFYRYAVTKLAAMPTRTLTRPLVLLLSHGIMPQYVRQRPQELGAPPPSSSPAEGGPVVFVPQKARAKRRVVLAAAVGGMSSAALVAWVLLRLL